MPFREKDTQLYREDEKSGHKKLGPEQREELIKVGLFLPCMAISLASLSIC